MDQKSPLASAIGSPEGKTDTDIEVVTLYEQYSAELFSYALSIARNEDSAGALHASIGAKPE